VFDESVSALRTLQASGWTVRLLPFDRKDLVVARRARRTLGDRTEIMSRFLDVDALRRSIAECDVLVGQRLHSVVLAAAVGVPAVAIDYRPKCRDFQLSIDRQDWTVSTIDITAGGVLDMVIALHEQRAHHADRIHQEVARAKRALRAGELELRRLFGAAPS
jgi:polysaccharide pyruvyl transferase WcaK-like protein